eukprot:3942255-Prymnesium_polylepis.1
MAHSLKPLLSDDTDISVLAVPTAAGALDALISRASDEAQGVGNKLGLTEFDALAACSRLCALGDDGSSETIESQQSDALLQMMLSGSIDTLNDINAATLVLATARKQLDTLEQDEIVAAKHSASANAGCVEMAGSIRRSEEL